MIFTLAGPEFMLSCALCQKHEMLPNMRSLKNITFVRFFGGKKTNHLKCLFFKQQQRKWKCWLFISSLDVDVDEGKRNRSFCSSKVATKDILSDNFVYKLSKICCCQPTAASSVLF